MLILEFPNDNLLIKTTPIQKVTPELLNIAQEMYTVMRAAKGIGLAANQVGLDMSLIVLEDDGKPLVLFNPVILKRGNILEYSSEGCLSFPNIFRIIKRPTEVTFKYRDEHNRMQYAVLKGLQARALIHEVDHLHGKLFTQIPEKD